MSLLLRPFVSLQRTYVGPTLLLGLIDPQESRRHTHKEEPTWDRLGRRREGRGGTVIAAELESISASTESLSVKVLPPPPPCLFSEAYGWLLTDI